MKKSAYAETASSPAPDWSKSIGTLRTAVISYEHTPIIPSNDGISIGQMIDMHIRQKIATGSLVQEVALTFETQEQQYNLRNYYENN